MKIALHRIPRYRFIRSARHFNQLVLLLLFGALAAVSGCADNPVTPEEHAEPVGLVVSAGIQELVRIQGNEVTGTLEVEEGMLSEQFTLQFVDEHGDLFVPDDPDMTPSATVGDSTVIGIERDAPEDWDFYVRGLKEGTTTLKLTIMHGGHPDYESPVFTAVVTRGGARPDEDAVEAASMNAPGNR